MNWIYNTNDDNSARFTLGEYDTFNSKTLICFGINPSTAMPDKLDPTLRKVKAISLSHNYLNWVMINVYPQRATNPNDLHLNCNEQLHSKNLSEIKNLLSNFNNADILFAYGNLIIKRPYLKVCLDDILNLINSVKFAGQKFCIRRTMEGNPVHPLYQKTNSTFIPY